MKCPKCEMTIPNDSEFCQYCGTVIITSKQKNSLENHNEGNPIVSLNPIIEESKDQTQTKEQQQKIILDGQVIQCPQCGMPLPQDSEFCQFCGKNISLYRETTPHNIEREKEKHIDVFVKPEHVASLKKKSSKESQNKLCQYIGIAIAILLLVSLAFNVVQKLKYNKQEEKMKNTENELVTEKNDNNDLKKKLETAEAKLEENGKIIEENKQKIGILEKNKEEYAKEALEYFLLREELKRGNIGYASSNFNASREVIALSRNETASFVLTAYWPNGGAVYTKSSTDCASITLDNSSWAYSTTVTVHPYKEGVTMVTFSNSNNNETFKVFIIVT